MDSLPAFAVPLVDIAPYVSGGETRLGSALPRSGYRVPGSRLRADPLRVTHDDAGREIQDGAVMLRGGWIEKVGSSAELEVWIAEAPAERAPDWWFDVPGCVLMPGLINGHHPLYQTLTRSIGTAIRAWSVARHRAHERGGAPHPCRHSPAWS